MNFRLHFLFSLFFMVSNFFVAQSFASVDLKHTPSKKSVHKFVLDNGMTVLIVPNQFSSEVATFLWYDVGSKHEGIGERGMAHFIEHMIFKGTDAMLSESDLKALGSKLSSYINAFTWYDYTTYVFKLPLQNWEQVLPLYADCMQHCRFKQDHMDSEVKAVIQELDMRRDGHVGSLAEAMASAIFDAHPYHYTVIGFKQDLCRLKRETLVNFYKKQYIPQNATLILVGDLDPKDAFEKVCQHFAQIPRGQDRPATNFYFNEDVQTQSVTLYRDVKQPIGAVAFTIPGLQEVSAFTLQVLGLLLTDSMSSRLYKKLIEQHGLVASVQSDDISMFEKNIFYVIYAPNRAEDIAQIKELILQELDDVVLNGFTPEEFNRAVKLAQVAQQSRFENVYNVGYDLGKEYLATGDEHALFATHDKNLYDDMMTLLQRYFRRSACHEGYVFNVVEQDKQYFQDRMQELQDMSAAMLAEKVRESELEPVRYAQTLTVNKLENKKFPKPKIMKLDNGLEVLMFHSVAVDLVKCALSYKANSLYDTPGQEGVGVLVAKMMLEGTKDLPGLQFVEAIQAYGISISTSPGWIGACMLPQDVDRGLGYVRSMVTDASFDLLNFEKIQNEQLINIKQAEDNPRFILSKTVDEIMYQNHPYSRPSTGTQHSIRSIDRDACFDFYQKYLSPQGARLVIVGNYDKDTIQQTVQDLFGSWQGEQIPEIVYPEIQPVEPCVVDISMNRDQVYLGFFGPSVAYLDQDYDYLNIFNCMLAEGMDSFLFELREQTGLFYTVGGSVASGACEQPGIISIRTMVAPDRVLEAQEKIVEVMTTCVDQITDEKFEQAQEALVLRCLKNYELLVSQIDTFLRLTRYDLPFDYYEKKIEKIRAMKKEEMQQVVKKYLRKDKLSCIRVGNF